VFEYSSHRIVLNLLSFELRIKKSYKGNYIALRKLKEIELNTRIMKNFSIALFLLAFFFAFQLPTPLESNRNFSIPIRVPDKILQ